MCPFLGPRQTSCEIVCKQLSAEVPGSKPLVEGCLQGERLAYQQLDVVAEARFHALDFAINALYDIGTQRQRVVFAAAFFFARKGVGKYALEQYLASRGELGHGAGGGGWPKARGLLSVSKKKVLAPYLFNDLISPETCLWRGPSSGFSSVLGGSGWKRASAAAQVGK